MVDWAEDRRRVRATIPCIYRAGETCSAESCLCLNALAEIARQARADALEEAAKFHDDKAAFWRSSHPWVMGWPEAVRRDVAEMHVRSAKRIRALEPKQ